MEAPADGGLPMRLKRLLNLLTLPKIRLRVQKTARHWLLGELHFLVSGIDHDMRIVGPMVEDLKTGLHALRDSEERHFRLTVDREQGFFDAQVSIDAKRDELLERMHTELERIRVVEETVGRVLLLLEPEMKKRVSKRPHEKDWDAIQAQNFEELEENSDGKPLRS